ncbi:MAG: hypothetical protein MJ211_15240 [Bacteroidales bacterium]|nr:hypothetical protein [Bacteroidales bacterium]
MGVNKFKAKGGNRALLNEYHRKKNSAAVWCVNFLPYKKKEYAFDYLGSSDHEIFATDEYYPKSENGYDFRYKSIETTKTDYVKVDFSNYNGIKDSVIFKDRYGIKLKLSKDNILTFTGTQKPDTNYIYAYDKDGVRIGKLMLKTYKPKTYNLVLVSVNGEKLPNTNKLKDYLNEIYKQSVTNFEISTTTLEINDLFPFKHGDKKRLSGYNDDQKRVLQAFDSQAKDDINYLFFMPDGVETNGVAGYNPFGYNFGFIYHGAGERTIAHELGHGIGSLKHPFDDQNRENGNTANLMDYNDKTELYHFQWDNIQNPPSRIFKWNFEEEGAEDVGKILATDYNFKILEKNITLASDTIFTDLTYIGKNYTFQFFKNDTIQKCNWKLSDIQQKDTTNFVLDISKPINDTLKVYQKDSLIARLQLKIDEFTDYKIKIVELDSILNSSDTLIVATEKDSVFHINLYRNEEIVKCDWKFNSETIQDTTSFSISISNEIKDKLEIYYKDLLLTFIQLEIKDFPYIFKIKDKNIEAQSGTEMLVVQQLRNLELQLFRNGKKIECYWKVDTTKIDSLTNSISIDCSNISTKKITVFDKNNKEIANVDFNIYEKAKIKFELLPTYKGEFGFDNYFEKYPIQLANTDNYRTFNILGKQQFIPWLTMLKNQSNVKLNLVVNVDNLFLKDSNAYLNLISSTTYIKTKFTSLSNNILTKNEIKYNNAKFEINLCANNITDSEQFICILDNSSDKIMKMLIKVKSLIEKKLNIIKIYDSINSISLNIDTSQLNNFSYNQAFIRWKFSIDSLYFPKKIETDSILHSTNRAKFQGMILYLMQKNMGISINKPELYPNDYFIFYVPIDYFDDAINLFPAYCYEISHNPFVFSHSIFLGNKSLSSKIVIHELGHSFQLRHTFENPYNITKGTTNNYMDYNDPNMNYYFMNQLKLINNLILK